MHPIERRIREMAEQDHHTPTFNGMGLQNHTFCQLCNRRRLELVDEYIEEHSQLKKEHFTT